MTETIEGLPPSVLTRYQVKTYGPKPIKGYGTGAQITAKVRYDDECRNGHNSFAITGEIRVLGRRDIEAGGCIHKEIAKAFPKLAPYIKWHLCSSDGPMHYISNTLHLAGDRDCWGRRKGEPSSFSKVVKFGDFPIKIKVSDKFADWLDGIKHNDFEVLPVAYEGKSDYKFDPKYTLGGYDCAWHSAPFESELEALQFLEAMGLGFEVWKVPTAWSEGKARELDAARRAAIWPEATDEQLCAEPEALKAALLERLPALMREFKAAVESLGFVY